MLCEKTDKYSTNSSYTHSCEGSSALSEPALYHSRDRLRVLEPENDTYSSDEPSVSPLDDNADDTGAETPQYEVTVQQESEPCDNDTADNDADSFSAEISDKKSTIRYALDGVEYEIAEELYIREKTEAENDERAAPPFHKVFDEQTRQRLDTQFRQRQNVGYGSNYGTAGEPYGSGITTARAFALQFVLMLPVINLITALFLSFRRKTAPSVKAYCRGFTIWTSLFLSAALGFFAFSYFMHPENYNYFTNLINSVIHK